MNDKELIEKLHTLKSVQPESSWKKETRDILLAQISNSVDDKEVKVSLFEIMAYDFKNLFSFLPSTAWAVICLVIILTGGTMGALAAKNSKPGDTLYFAKAWKEKIQLAMTFNQEDKAKLDMKLASIHAEEIAAELSNPSFNVPGNQKKAEELAQNFQQEMNTVKASYSEINKIQQKNSSPADSGVAAGKASSNLAVANDDSEVGIGNLQKSTDSKVYDVESGKDSKGLQFYNPNDSSKNTAGTATVSPVASPAPAINNSSSPATANTASSTAESDNISVALDKATQDASTNDYPAAANIMNQVIENIDSGSGTVKGAVDSGTSSDNGNSAGAVGSSSGK
jgi:Domain of unknown function (DUF5667)